MRGPVDVDDSKGLEELVQVDEAVFVEVDGLGDLPDVGGRQRPLRIGSEDLKRAILEWPGGGGRPRWRR